MQFNYDQLKEAIAEYTLEGQAQTNPAFFEALPTIIALAEDRIINDLQPNVFDKTVEIVATIGSQILPKPNGYLGIRSIFLSPDGISWDPLFRRDKTWIDNFWRNPSLLGEPMYVANFDAVSFKVAPTPILEYHIRLTYIARPESISDSNPVTWMSQNVGELLLYACLCEAMIYLREDPSSEGGMTAAFVEKYQSTLSTIKSKINNQYTKGKYF